MKLYTYKEHNQTCEKIGISYDGEMLYNIDLFGLSFKNMNELICNITDEQMSNLKIKPNENGISLKDVTIL